MNDKNKTEWLFLYWDEPIDIKKEENNPKPTKEEDDLH